MTAEQLKGQTKDEVMAFIRQKLDNGEMKNPNRRFEMSGYESETGACTVHNMAILNEFANLGIYDYTEFLFLDFYKGMPKLYLKYWNDGRLLENDEWGGMGSTEIIYNIFGLTIFTDKPKRRRD